MFNNINEPPPPMPEVDLRQTDESISVISPLTRRGNGPGIILLVPESNAPTAVVDGVPSLLVKWAEEGYTVVEIQRRALAENAAHVIKSSIECLLAHPKCEPKDKLGLVAYDTLGWNLAAEAINDANEIVATVVYADDAQRSTIKTSRSPTLQHFAGGAPDRPQRTAALTIYQYSGVKSYLFATPFQELFNYTTEAISHTRNIMHLKKNMQGPYFDLELIWDEHTYYEFADRSVEHTMSTMVQEPYVNHVPTLTGGIGRDNLTNFYRHNFIFNNSADTNLELISRSIAIDRIIDEFIFKFTHDREIDWLLPGVPPTNLKVEVPFTAVVNIRGDRLYHEHISWDQGTVMRQLGLLPEYLPFPYQLPGGGSPSPGKRFEFRVPVAGLECANKMRDRNSVLSNEMFDFKIREAQEMHGNS